MKNTTLSILAFSVLVINQGQASEADTFTRRSEAFVSAAEIINTKANKAIQDSLVNANAKNEGCVEKALYTELRVYFNNHMKGRLTIDIIKDNNIPKLEIALADSIYGNWSPWDGLGMGLSFMKKTKETLATVVKIDEHIIGVDKFEHMFGQGYFYFSDNYLKKKGVIAAVKNGAMREKIILGGNKIANGIFSYGDLSANFNGMRMWNHMLQLRDDVMGSEYNIGPYVACENKKWVQVKELDFRNYIDDSMDEAINCSKFTSESTVRKFKKNIKERGFDACPIDQRRLDDMIAKYGPMSKWMINKEGPGVVKYFSEFKDK